MGLFAIISGGNLTSQKGVCTTNPALTNQSIKETEMADLKSSIVPTVVERQIPLHKRGIKNHSEDIWRFIQKGEPDECWLWLGSRLKNGYGRFRLSGKTRLAHRVVYLITFGECPDDLLVCHTCDNPPCCNPNHLFLGTNADNQRDCTEKGRQANVLKNGKHTKPEATPRGERHGRAKIKDCDIPRIFELRKQGMTHRQIAKVFGVYETCIGKILSGKLRKHLQVEGERKEVTL
jgi:hypothetical protein